MRDIIYTAATAVPRDALVARLSEPSELLWNIAPKSVVRRMYLVHQSEIIGWLQVEDQLEIGDEPVMVKRFDTGEFYPLCNAKRLVTRGPIALLERPVPWGGFRGFRYFDPDDIEQEQVCAQPA